jgi:hypothetical protein
MSACRPNAALVVCRALWAVVRECAPCETFDLVRVRVLAIQGRMPMFKHTFAALLSCCLCACATGTPDAESPIGVSRTPGSAAGGACSEPGSAPTALPRYLSLRVAGDEVWVGDEALRGDALFERLRSEARDPRNQGAALLIDSTTSTHQISRWTARVLDAGFSHVVLSTVARPASDAPAEDGGTSAVVPVMPPAESASTPASAAPPVQPGASPVGALEPAAPSVSAPSDAPPVKVEVKQMGLHIGGGPNTEEEVARYAVPIAKRFPEFRDCYALSHGTRKAASFGVDLLVTSRGGRAKIKDFRTVLTGKDFLGCMLDVFGTVEFVGPARDTVVSYSLLFKPQAP